VAREMQTTRFGPIRFEPEDLIRFPAGLLGLEDSRDWILLGDGQNDAMAWLQCVDQPRVALAVVSPRRFVPAYRIRVARAEIEPLDIEDVRGAEVLVVVGRTEHAITLNLKAPLVINVARRLARQVITNGDWPVRYELPGRLVALKKIA
jgi:flagellar assembly factor FliW